MHYYYSVHVHLSCSLSLSLPLLGCGKTTFIDLLAGRQNLGSYSGKIIVNGYPMERVREWYVSHTGYVLQLASPYYESLTVRENLTLAAQMRLAKSYTMDQKLNRVEQILREVSICVYCVCVCVCVNVVHSFTIHVMYIYTF